MRMKMKMKTKTQWLALLALVFAGGFASPAAVSAQETVEADTKVERTKDEKEDRKKNEIRVRVRNYNMRELQVYLVPGPIGSPYTSRISLGRVVAQSTGTFKLRESVLRHGGGQFRILVRPVGTRQFLASEHIVVRKGATVEWTLVRPLRSGGYISITD